MSKNTLKELERVINCHMRDKIEIKFNCVPIDWDKMSEVFAKYFQQALASGHPSIIVPYEKTHKTK